ncbi:MAG: hypothetical protein QXT47_02785 [Desulfurococcaceae archaeon]
MKSDKTPPGHCSISNLIIYSILGIPKIEDVSKWRIELEEKMEKSLIGV